MKTKGKKIVTLFLVVSLVMLSANLYAKEKGGSKLLITKTDGQQIRGELITVKEDSLLLLDSESGVDESVDIDDIKVIKIMKVSKVWEGARIGGFIAAVGGISILIASEGDGVGFLPFGVLTWHGILGGAIGAIVGGFIGASLGKEVTIQIEGMTDSEVEETLEKLRKKARIPDYK